MATVVLKLFTGQCSVTDGRTNKAATLCFPLRGHKKGYYPMTVDRKFNKMIEYNLSSQIKVQHLAFGSPSTQSNNYVKCFHLYRTIAIEHLNRRECSILIGKVSYIMICFIFIKSLMLSIIV